MSAQAISHAVNTWKVDIISISLGFTEVDEQLEDEIRRACGNKVLIFASAANNNTNEVIPVRFPARMREVMGIYSSDTHGKPSPFNPPPKPDRGNFTFPGENIEGAWPSNLADEDTVRRGSACYKLSDGTSCPTPLAAAVAAGVLEYAWQEREHRIRRVGVLKHHSGMSENFLKRMVDDYKPEEKIHRYVKPWKLISRYRRKDEIPIQISDTLDNIDG
jgi:hypothetical protein